ncbi:hypothetical protein MUP38_01045, partial [Candidatus Bathyarchaeota archaeon]|nr:hypothetical protein [Candidatus Bathyarchaeota archaeon]
MKTAYAGVFLAVLLVSTFSLVLVVNAQSVGSNLLVNGDFERGSFDGWAANGTCSISNGTVHSGSYSAYLSDRSFDSVLNQTVMLPATGVLYAEGWIYPTRVGSLGGAFCPSAQIDFHFRSKLPMINDFKIGVVWCWNDAHLTCNSSSYLSLLLPFNASSWNHLSLNLTDAVHSYF